VDNNTRTAIKQKSKNKMKLIVLGSSSKGNCYLLQSENGKCLMIEAGIDFKKVKQAIDFKTSNVVGCLLTHSHSDHSKYAKEVLSSCIEIYTSKETKEALGLKNDKLIEVEPNIKFQIDDFGIIPFDVPHDVQCFGYYINHNECGNVAFITDCYYVPTRFTNLNNIMIEANYDDRILKSNVKSGKISTAQYNRAIQSHFSYATCRETLLANDLRAVNNIVLIHLSDGNSNAAEFWEGIADATEKQVWVADKGMVLSFNKFPF